MAFLRREIKKGRTYLSICENYRDEKGKVQRRTLHNLGNIENYSDESLERIGRQLIEMVKGPTPEPQNIEELSRHNYGYPLVLYRLLCLYDLDALMNRFGRKHKLSFSLLRSVLLMLCDRFNDPLSKLGSYHLQNEYIGLGEVSLQHLYRSLDYLAQHNDTIQTHIYNKNRSLFNYELDVVFYDVTTFYFDSDVEQPDTLRQMGFGKDGKVGQTQVLFSLLIDKNKIPVGFQVFKGNTYEGHTFEQAVRRLKKKYNIKRIIVVADSGMLNKDNLELFAVDGMAENLEYIVGDRIKNLTEAVRQYLTTIDNYTSITVKDDDGKDIPLQYCAYKYNGRTIISTWSAKRAAKDKADREARIQKAEKMLKHPSLIERKARKNYLKPIGKKQYELDTEKIKEQERYDGFKAVATNVDGLTPQLILEKYKDLYKIEQSFRTFKSYLETRPMFHWTDSRIEGHLVLCYIAFCLLSFLQYRLVEKTGQRFSEETIRRTLSKMELSKIIQDENIIWLRSALTMEAQAIINTIQLKQIPNAVSNHTIESLLPPTL